MRAARGHFTPRPGDRPDRVTGITGPPGAGKSTLVDALARIARERGETVAILAVDPSSPYTGGALLGDRVRMQRLYTDPGVFIRSMATRGALGGLAAATHDAVDLLTDAGFDRVLVETVGVGQDEVDVLTAADTVVVVTVPGLGDGVQAHKAGLFEIADLYVVNKADRDGADAARRDLERMLDEADVPAEQQPPVLATVATEDRGVTELLDAVDARRQDLADDGTLARRRRERLRLRVERSLTARALEAARDAGLEEVLSDAAEDPGADPHELAGKLWHRLTHSAHD